MPVTDVAEQLECVPVAGCGLLVPSYLLRDTEIVEGAGLAGSIAEFAVELQCLGRAGGSGLVFAGCALHGG